MSKMTTRLLLNFTINMEIVRLHVMYLILGPPHATQENESIFNTILWLLFFHKRVLLSYSTNKKIIYRTIILQILGEKHQYNEIKFVFYYLYLSNIICIIYIYISILDWLRIPHVTSDLYKLENWKPKR